MCSSDLLTNTPFDNESTTLRVSVNHTISMRLAFNVAWDRTQRNFTTVTTAPREQDATLSASLNRTLGRHFNVAFGIADYERHGAQTYDERRYELRLGYSPTQGNTALGLVGR